jgi:hypothetical protein
LTLICKPGAYRTGNTELGCAQTHISTRSV